MTADQALAIIDSDYDLGAGGGQLSNLIHEVLVLRAQGFKPSNANKLAIEEALEHRPNQTPLVEALKETLAYQRKMQAQAAAQHAAAGRPPASTAVPGMPPQSPGMTRSRSVRGPAHQHPARLTLPSCSTKNC